MGVRRTEPLTALWRTPRRWTSGALALGSLLSVACTGTILDLDGQSGGSSGAGAGAGAGANGGDPGPAPTSGRDPGEAGYGDDPGGLSDIPAPTTRAARLTHTQWRNSVRDLFQLEDASIFSTSFRPDSAQRGFLFDNDGSSLSVDGALWSEYQRAAADIAAHMTGDAARLSAILPAGTDGEERARAFITEFGARVHRRPLTETDVDDYMGVYRAAVGTYSGLSDFQAGIRLVIEAFLQSPHFVYRLEPSTTRVGNVIPLDNYEVASRLSYMLWNSMPDEELFAAAAAGSLVRASEAAQQAERMLRDPRAEQVVGAFHEQLLDIQKYAQIAPSTTRFPEASADLGRSAMLETNAFVQSIVFEQGGGFADLLTSTRTFVNDDLAKVYGVSGSFGSTLSPVDLDPSRRSGFLTQVGFLASNATSLDPDPIHRGVFVVKHVLCGKIAAPPGEIPPLPAPQGRTNRQTVEEHTQKPDTVCANCHLTTINPLGFPFENYDAVGGYRTQDNGHPVDAATSPVIDGTPTPVQNAVELIAALSESAQTHECYTRHWLEFAYGRAHVDSDRTLVKRLGKNSIESGLSVQELIVGLVKSEAFLTRSMEELP